MTNLKVAEDLIGSNYPFDEDTFNTGLLVAGIDPGADFVPGKSFDIAFASFIMFLTSAATKISEGGYTVEIDPKNLLNLRKVLLAKWGISDNMGATLVDRTYLW